jgi:hypothetical protein
LEFIVREITESVSDVARLIGYSVAELKENGEYVLVKNQSGDDLSCFHICLEVKGETFIFNLYLDQKESSYNGLVSSGKKEYFGPAIEEEADRIEEILDQEDRI